MSAVEIIFAFLYLCSLWGGVAACFAAEQYIQEIDENLSKEQQAKTILKNAMYIFICGPIAWILCLAVWFYFKMFIPFVKDLYNFIIRMIVKWIL